MLNALTIDVEDYYHATNLEPEAPPRKWHLLTPRIRTSLPRTLQLLQDNNTKATFFILGHIARRHPQIVREIADQGHEIASHGYAHRLVYRQSEQQFARDIRKSKYLLEQLTGKPVLGYRAPNFSITQAVPWAYDQLAAAGYRYDSSLHPVRHTRYGNRDRGILPEIVETAYGPLAVFPLAVFETSIFGRTVRLPVAGGAWWRLFPLAYSDTLLRRIENSRPMICYFHPWEVDAGQPRFDSLPLLTKWRHYGGLANFPAKLTTLMKHYRFGRILDLAASVYPDRFTCA
jgi:polysaccharide deacetylase family protein (PEP-CTERM system associated)